MTPAERVVVEMAVRWAAGHTVDKPLLKAVDALLAERAGPQPRLVEITWGQVAEGDMIYRSLATGGALPPDAPGGTWREVLRAGPLAGTDKVRINARGIPKPIQPPAANPVIVRRGATGKAVDALGSVLWSGPSARTVREE
jgi:hypothetical protein